MNIPESGYSQQSTDPQERLRTSAKFLLAIEDKQQYVVAETPDGDASVIAPFYMNAADSGAEVGVWAIRTSSLSARVNMVPSDGGPTFSASITEVGKRNYHPASSVEMSTIADIVVNASDLWQKASDRTQRVADSAQHRRRSLLRSLIRRPDYS
jgi:hypothetical protein